MLTPIHDLDAIGKVVKLFRHEYDWCVCIFTDGTFVALRARGDGQSAYIELLSTIDDAMAIGDHNAVKLGLMTQAERDERHAKWMAERDANHEKWERELFAKLKAKYETGGSQ